MSSTDRPNPTTPTYYIAVTSDRTQREVIWGIGTSEEAALLDAGDWYTRNAEPDLDADGEILQPDLMAIECSLALYDEISSRGYCHQRWTDNGTGGVAMLNAELEELQKARLLAALVEYAAPRLPRVAQPAVKRGRDALGGTGDVTEAIADLCLAVLHLHPNGRASR
jgi:hypothetical protein